MLTPEKLSTLTAEEKTDLFEKLAKLYGKTWEKLAADLGLGGASTIQVWRKCHTVPDMALFTLDNWVNSAEAQALDAQHMATTLQGVTKGLGAMAKILDRVTARAIGSTSAP